MMLELEHAYSLFDADDRIKCIVFTGTGKIFCAGADLELGFNPDQEEKINEHRDGYVWFSFGLGFVDWIWTEEGLELRAVDANVFV